MDPVGEEAVDRDGGELKRSDHGSALARRKKIHIELSVPAKAKGAHAANAAMGQEHDATVKLADAFTTSAAVMTETSERTLRREVRRGEVLGDEVLSKVAGTSLDKGEELDTLTKLSPKKRNELIERAAAGESVSAKVQAKQEHREQREAKLGEKVAAGKLALPAKRYGIILADWPHKPWAYFDETGVDRSPATPYSVQDFGCPP
jgi:hypothetical protein